MRPLFVASLLALAACGPRDDAQSVQVASPTASVAPAPAGDPDISAAQLVGEYRVAGVGGESIDLPHAITLSLSSDRITLVADCVNAVWGYHLERGSLATKRLPVMSCQRGLMAQEQAVFAALDGATRIVHLPSGAYEVSGQGPSLTIFTQ
ncbi:MAG: META domain-containing protein [Croceibacterium sp.]